MPKMKTKSSAKKLLRPKQSLKRLLNNPLA